MNHRLFWRQVFALIALFLAGASAHSQTLDRDLLAGLSLEFADVSAVTARPGRERLMRLDTLPGDRLSLHLPFRPDRIEWLVSDGSEVKGMQTIARVYGPELEHWMLEADLLKERFADARLRYERSKPLYEQQSLPADKWQSIVEYYHRLRIEHQHMSHVLEWLNADPSEGADHTAVLRAPLSGLLLMGVSAVDKAPIAEIVDPGSLRLTAQTPQARRETVIALRVDNCELPLARDASRVTGFSRRLWSAPAGACLPARPGMTLSGVPVYRFSGYAVPRDAILSFEGRTYLALESSAGLELAAVTIAGEDRAQFYVTSPQALNGVRALIRSTSAVQGLLLGLGAN